MAQERKADDRLKELKSYGFYLVGQKVSAGNIFSGIQEGHLILIEDFSGEGCEVLLENRFLDSSAYDSLLKQWEKSASTPLGRQKHPVIRYLETRTAPEILEQLSAPLPVSLSNREIKVGGGIIKVVKDNESLDYQLDLDIHRLVCGRTFSLALGKTLVYDFLLPSYKYLLKS